MKIIKSIFWCVTVTFAVLVVEPLRIFAGLVSIAVFLMMCVESWRSAKRRR